MCHWTSLSPIPNPLPPSFVLCGRCLGCCSPLHCCFVFSPAFTVPRLCPDPDILGKLKQVSNTALAGGQEATEQIMEYVCRPFDNQHSYFVLMSHMTPSCRPVNHSWEWFSASLAFRWFQGMEGDPTSLWCWGFLSGSDLPSKHAQDSGCCHCEWPITGPGGVSISLVVKPGTKSVPGPLRSGCRAMLLLWQMPTDKETWLDEV